MSAQEMKTVKALLMAGAFAAAGAFGPVGSAPVQAAEAQQQTEQLAEVTVTARRQEESLQKTPVSVTAVQGDLIEKMHLKDITRVAEFVPNLTIAPQPSSTTATSIIIRGIGQTEPAATADQGVGIYLDGVYIARTAGAVFDLVDLERVEVLRGPQGTLFGRNTIGGAMQLISRKPGDTFGIDEKLNFGRFSQFSTRTRLDTGYLFGSPVKATLAYLHGQSNGYFDNTLAPSSRAPNAYGNDALWASLYGAFGDRFTAYYTFDYDKRRGTPPFFQMVAATPAVAAYYGRSPMFGGAPFQLSSERLNSGQQAPFEGRFSSYSETLGHDLTLEYKMSDAASLKSVSSYRSFNQDTICSLTGNGVMRGVVLDPVTFAPSIGDLNGPYQCNNAPQRQFQYSEELQLLGHTAQWSYVAGAYYFYERSSEYNRQSFTFVLPGGMAALNLSPVSSFGGKTTSKAAFGQVSYRPAALAEKLEFTGGLRYTKDDKGFFSNLFTQPGNASFSNTSWLASANYLITDAVSAYARVSTGYKAGGFSPRAPFLAEFQPEKVTAYEIGLKAEWFNRRLRTNVSVYDTKYKDLQVSQFQSGTGGSVAYVVNAGRATIRGFELEVAAVLAEGLTLDAAYGYTDPKFDQYLFRDPMTNLISDVSNTARFQAVSKDNLHVGLQYNFKPFSVGQVTTRVDWTQRSESYFYPLDSINIFNEQVKNPGTKNLRARIALAEMPMGSKGSWEVGIWGDNLTNHDNVGYGIDFGGLGFGGLFYTDPRRYGIDMRFSF
ncbi:MAG: TonB-dependent receptor [Steroidobacteraceae bacterium]